MMEANELRIGNLVLGYGAGNPLHETLSVVRVARISDKHIRYMGYGCEYLIKKCEPIPLAEEWKNKLKSTPIFMDKQGFVIFKNGYEYAFTWDEYPFVHSVQNLYFAINGEELNVK